MIKRIENNELLQDSSRRSIAFTHLGCEKNLVDTEHMLGLLTEAGYLVTNEKENANIVVVNTCSFIQDAREESVKTLVSLAEQGKELIIAGCLAQHFKNELLESLPEAKAIVGTGDYQHIVEVLKRIEQGERVNQVSEQPSFVGDENLPRFRTTKHSIAYIKIAEGCDYNCSFCIIPKLRGIQRSRPIESIVAEAHQLAEEGVKELILISQISTNYGLDLYGHACLEDLLRALGDVKIPWIRVHYAYPTGLTKKVLAAYREVPNVVPYLDIPLQHSHPSVLKAMNRPWQKNINTDLVKKIRDEIPDAVLRTTLIVGFPGETKSQFEHLADFIKVQEFDHVGIFKYSPEANTPAAILSNQIDPKVAEARKDKLMSIQQPISEKLNKKCIGKIMDVLIEDSNSDTGEILGRCYRFSPEIDGQVIIDNKRSYKENIIGEILQVLITSANVYDLNGKVVGIDEMLVKNRKLNQINQTPHAAGKESEEN